MTASVVPKNSHKIKLCKAYSYSYEVGKSFFLRNKFPNDNPYRTLVVSLASGRGLQCLFKNSFYLHL